LITAHYHKDPGDPGYANEPAMKEWVEFMKKYYPEGNLADSFNMYGYLAAQTMVQVLKQCGNDLSRENVMKQAASLDLALPLLHRGALRSRPGRRTFFPIKQMRLMKFDGAKWVAFGDAITG